MNDGNTSVRQVLGSTPHLGGCYFCIFEVVGPCMLEVELGKEVEIELGFDP